MKRILKGSVLMLACFSFAALGQDWYHQRDQRFRGEGWRGHVFDQVRMDLEHIGSAAFAAEKEQRRLQRTKQELAELQAKLEGGRFDNGELNDVIDSIAKSSNDERLSPRDREVLRDDLNRLHDYQVNHNRWKR
jgi:hypothetical protein